MSLVLAATLAAALGASTATVPTCSWDHPGAHPFGGDVVAAVDRYSDIAAEVRAALKQRMAQHRYDDLVRITHNRIEGKQRYGELRDMQLGNGQVCLSVSRAGWSLSAVAQGEVYCEGGHCLVVPTAGRNLSRLTRVSQTPAAGGPGAGGEAVIGTLAGLPFPAIAEVADELPFDAPSAGLAEPAARLSDGLVQATPDAAQEMPPSLAAFGFAAAAGSPGFSSAAAQGGGSGASAAAGAANPAGSPSFAAAAAGDGADRAKPGSVGGAGTDTVPIVPTVAPPVPEPSTWALMLAGLALVARACRRRAAA